MQKRIGQLCWISAEKSVLKGFTLLRHRDFMKCRNTCAPQIRKKSSRIKFQFSTNISLLSSQVGKTKLYILSTIKKVSLNKPSKHQIEIPSFLKDCTSFGIFCPPFGSLIYWWSTPTEDLEPNISSMWRSVSS